MRFAASLCLLAFAVLGCAQPVPAAPARPVLAPGRYVETLKVGDLERRFILRVPKNNNGTVPAPLVLVFHGWSGSAEAAEVYTGFADKAEAAGFLVAFGDGVGRPQGWNTGFLNLGRAGTDDVAYVRAMLDTIRAKTNVDPKRIYAAGHSNGAMFANLLGATMPETFAAIGSVAGTIGLDRVEPKRLLPDPKGPVSAILIHGMEDPTVAYGDDSKAVLRGVSAPNAARWWARANGIDGEPTRTTVGNILTDTWSGGRDGTSVVLVSVTNGDHDWPGGFGRAGRETRSGIRAVDLIWDFFVRHPKR